MAGAAPWELWLVLAGGGMQLAGAAVLGIFALRYVRFGDEGVAWRGHRLRPLAADARRLRMGAAGFALLVAGWVVLAVPLAAGALRLLLG